MGLQARGVDHDTLGSRPFAGQRGEDAVEKSPAGSSRKAVAECFVRAISPPAHPSTASHCGSCRQCRLILSLSHQLRVEVRTRIPSRLKMGRGLAHAHKPIQRLARLDLVGIAARLLR